MRQEDRDRARPAVPAGGRVISALASLDAMTGRMRASRVAFLLDYDGALTPIVERPEPAILSDPMRETLRELARDFTVAIVSGRDRTDVESSVGLDGVFYAGSHGFDVQGPNCSAQHAEGAKLAPALRAAARDLRDRVAAIDGAQVEEKGFAVAVDYRRAATADHAAIGQAVDQVARAHPDLRRTEEKKVFELRPRVEWDKGRAVLWLLTALGLDGPGVLPVYLGGDATDEDAFATLRVRGIGIRVGEEIERTYARYRLRDPDEARLFLERVCSRLRPAAG